MKGRKAPAEPAEGCIVPSSFGKMSATRAREIVVARTWMPPADQSQCMSVGLNCRKLNALNEEFVEVK